MPTTDDTEHWKTFGRWLRATRKERTYRTGRPRHELAKLAGVSDNTWGTWERGGRNMGGNWVVYRPKQESLVGIAHALGLPVTDVFSKAKVTVDPHLADTRPISAIEDDMLSQLMDKVSQIADRLEELALVRPSDEMGDLRAKLNELLAEQDKAKRRS